MWTPTTREYYSRPVVRYKTDLTEVEWRFCQHSRQQMHPVFWRRNDGSVRARATASGQRRSVQL
jgi:hypothetical protein